MRILPGRKYPSGTLWCVSRWTDVDPEGDGETYLTRLHLFRVPWCSCILHWILRPDPQPDLHDHPVFFLSIVLSGYYDEEIPNSCGSRRTVRIKWWNFKRATDRHRIVAVAGRVLTLVFAGPAVREWGFHTADGWVPWREYVARQSAENCRKPDAPSIGHTIVSDTHEDGLSQAACTRAVENKPVCPINKPTGRELEPEF